MPEIPLNIRRRLAAAKGLQLGQDGTIDSFDQKTSDLQEQIAKGDSLSSFDTNRLVAREGPYSPNRRVIDSGQGTVVGNAVQRGLGQINEGLGQAIRGVGMQFGGDPDDGDNSLAAFGEFLAGAGIITRTVEGKDPDLSGAESFLADVIETAAPMTFDAGVAALALATTGNPNLAKMAFANSAGVRAGGLQFGESFDQFRDAGLSYEESLNQATIDGVARGVIAMATERVAAGVFSRLPAGKAILLEGARGTAMRLLSGAAAEGSTEVIEDLIFDVQAAFRRSGDERTAELVPEFFTMDSIKDRGRTFALGAAVGGAVSGSATAIGAIANLGDRPSRREVASVLAEAGTTPQEFQRANGVDLTSADGRASAVQFARSVQQPEGVIDGDPDVAQMSTRDRTEDDFAEATAGIAGDPDVARMGDQDRATREQRLRTSSRMNAIPDEGVALEERGRLSEGAAGETFTGDVTETFNVQDRQAEAKTEADAVAEAKVERLKAIAAVKRRRQEAGISRPSDRPKIGREGTARIDAMAPTTVPVTNDPAPIAGDSANLTVPEEGEVAAAFAKMTDAEVAEQFGDLGDVTYDPKVGAFVNAEGEVVPVTNAQKRQLLKKQTKQRPPRKKTTREDFRARLNEEVGAEVRKSVGQLERNTSVGRAQALKRLIKTQGDADSKWGAVARFAEAAGSTVVRLVKPTNALRGLEANLKRRGIEVVFVTSDSTQLAMNDRHPSGSRRILVNLSALKTSDGKLDTRLTEAVVAHEIAHILEGSKEWGNVLADLVGKPELKQAAKAYHAALPEEGRPDFDTWFASPEGRSEAVATYVQDRIQNDNGARRRFIETMVGKDAASKTKRRTLLRALLDAVRSIRAAMNFAPNPRLDSFSTQLQSALDQTNGEFVAAAYGPAAQRVGVQFATTSSLDAAVEANGKPFTRRRWRDMFSLFNDTQRPGRIGRKLSSRGALPRDLADIPIDRQNEAKAAEARAVRTSEKLSKQLAGKSKSEIQAVRDAMVNDDPEARREALRTLPADRRALVQELRSEIDRFHNLLQPYYTNIVGVVDAGGGVYLHRSYKAFHEKGWVEDLSKNEELLERFRAYFKENWEGFSETVTVDGVAKRRTLAEIGYEQSDIDAMPPEAVNAFAVEIAEHAATASNVETLMGGPDRFRDIIKSRKDIDPMIREVLGEYRDPAHNAMQTLVKQARLNATVQTFEDIREAGIGRIFFDSKTKQEGMIRLKDAGELPPEMSRIAEFYTWPEVAKTVIELNNTGFKVDGVMNQIAELNSLTRFGKTVISPQTGVRNYFGNAPFAMMNGHAFTLASLFTGFRGEKAIAASSFATIKDGFNNILNRGKSDQRFDYLNHAQTLGLVGQDFDAAEYDKSLRSGGLVAALDRAAEGNKAGRGAKTVVGLMKRAYQSGDTTWKLFAFEVEMARHMKATGIKKDVDADGKPIGEYLALQKKVARKVVDVYPSYDRLPKWVQELRRFPLMGTFVSFHVAMGLSTARTFKHMTEELSDPKLRGIGVQRLQGILTTVVAAAALKAVIEGVARSALSDDDEEGMRKLLPHFSQNSTIIQLGRREDGKYRYLDVSYTDPHSAFRSAFRSMSRYVKGDIDESQLAAAMMSSMAGPMIQPEFIPRFLAESALNKKFGGGSVWSEGDSATVKGQKIAAHAWKTMQPGLTKQASDFYKAATGDIRPGTGEVFSMSDELFTTFTGQKPVTFDPVRALEYRSFAYQGVRRSVKGQFNKLIRQYGTVSPTEVAKVYNYVNARTADVFWDLRDAALAASVLSGVTPAQMAPQLAAIVGRRQAAQILTGTYVPIELATDTAKAALLKAGNDRENVIARIRAAIAARGAAIRDASRSDG